MAKIADFQAQMRHGGARPNQFKVLLAFPSWISNAAGEANKGEFLCKSASLPASTIQPVQVQYRGRQVNFAGERSFDPWSISVYNDNDFSLRSAFEEWLQQVQQRAATSGRIKPLDYQVDMEVHQLDRNGLILRKYKFFDSFPITVGEIVLDFDAANQIEMFPVQIMYNYWDLI